MITQADANANPLGSLIQFDPTVFSSPQTITLNSALPDLSNTTGPMDIEGPGAASLTVARSDALWTPSFRIFTVDWNTSVEVNGLTLTGGLALEGGGVANFGGTVGLSNCIVEGNSLYYENGKIIAGGGIYNYGNGGLGSGGRMSLSNCTVSGNSAFYGSGGGIANYVGTVTIDSGSIVANNTASDSGGGIDNMGVLTVQGGSTISANSANDGSGGGINSVSGGTVNGMRTGTVTFSDSTLTGNSAAGDGGGIYSGGWLTVARSTISNNSAHGSGDVYAPGGGGIYDWYGTLTISNSTVAYNSVNVTGSVIHPGGGGIYFFGGSATVADSSMAYNSVNQGSGGLEIWSPTAVVLVNSIVALNTSGSATASDIDGAVDPASSFDLIGTGGSGGLIDGVNGNQVGVTDPGLDSSGLQNNGGPTQTIALLAGSPAVDAGSNALAVDPTTGLPLTTDQRGDGFPRIVGNAVDIGAFELQPPIGLVVTAQPPDSVTAGSSFGLTVTAEDSSGNVDTSFNGTVTVALDKNPGGATLGGTLTVTAQSGVATFSGLTLDKADTGYTLLVSGSGVAETITGAISVTPAAATQMAVTSQPPVTVLVGSKFALTVSAEDPFGNVDPTYNGSVYLALFNNPGGATLGGTLNVTAQSGVATFTGLSLDQVGTGYTLQVSSTGLTAGTTSPFNVELPQLVVTAQPPGVVTVGQDFGLTVTAEDSSGNVDTSFNGTVTVELANNPGGANLGGTQEVSAQAGVATFSDLTLDAAASGYTLSVMSPPLASATTAPFDVTNAGTDLLVVTTQPPSSVAYGQNFGFTVAVMDEFGNVDTTFNGVVTATAEPYPGYTWSATATGGVATFSNLALGIGSYVVDVSSEGMTSTTTNPIDVTPGYATSVRVTSQPSGGQVNSPFGLAATLYDEYGNVATNFQGTVSVSVVPMSDPRGNNIYPYGYKLGGTTSVWVDNGVATFTNLTLDPGSYGYQLNVSVDGTGISTQTAEFYVAPLPDHIVITDPPPTALKPGQSFGLTVAAEDSSGNIDPSFSGPIVVQETDVSFPYYVVFPNVWASGGVASFTGLTIDPRSVGPATFSVWSPDAGNGGAGFAINLSTATQLTVTAQPSPIYPDTSILTGHPFSLVVAATDEWGNVDPTFTGSVAITLASNPGGATLGGTLTETAQNGVATFTDLTLDQPGIGYTLQVSSDGLTSAITDPFNVTAGQLVVTAQPPGVATVGLGFGLTVTAEDSSGNVETSFNGAVIVALDNNPGGATLGGTLNVTAQSGVATFSGLTLDQVGTGYTLQISGTGLGAATTSPFDVQTNTAPTQYTVDLTSDTGADRAARATCSTSSPRPTPMRIPSAA